MLLCLGRGVVPTATRGLLGERSYNMKYEEAIAKLEQIARQLEQNQLPIDQIAAQLREAQELVKYCREQLTSVDEEIKKIVGEETAE